MAKQSPGEEQDQDGGESEREQQKNSPEGAALAPSPGSRLGVGDQREGDHGVERQKPAREDPIEQQLPAFLEAEDRRSHLVSHLPEIRQREVGDRLGIGAPLRLDRKSV